MKFKFKGIFFSLVIFFTLSGITVYYISSKRASLKDFSVSNSQLNSETISMTYPSDEDNDDDYENVNNLGDLGDNSNLIHGIDTILPITKSSSYHSTMFEIALKYNGKIPYAVGGRYWLEGYPVFPDGIDNRLLPEGTSIGLDSLGYVIWLYRNTFGYSDELFERPIDLYSKSEKVLEAELQVGDIGMLTNIESETNHFGICIGFDHNIPVFTHCESKADILYPCGNTRFAYLKSIHNSYYMGKPPVEFNYFFRPEVKWGDSDATY